MNYTIIYQKFNVFNLNNTTGLQKIQVDVTN